MEWFLKKIPKNQKTSVQYIKDGEVIGIVCRHLLTLEFSYFEVNSIDKTLVLLGKSKNPKTLENKFFETKQDKVLKKNKKTKE